MSELAILAQKIVGKKILNVEVSESDGVMIITFYTGQKVGFWAEGPESCSDAPWLECFFKEVDIDIASRLSRND